LLVPVLTGLESPLETLFPGGSFATAEFLYERWALTRYFNGIAHAVAGAIEANAPQGRSLRVVEIGAGSGGMTSALLQVLSPKDLTYFFTDISEAFLTRAKRRFADHPCVRYGLLNIEDAPATQGYSAGSFDLVVAANSVHATKNLRASLANIRTLLGPGGILLLYEVTDHLPWFEMSVGLIEGWERFADDIRGEDPLLKPGQWTRLLAESGFSAAESLPRSGAPAEVLGHHILIARMPGEIGMDSASAEKNERGDQPSAVEAKEPRGVPDAMENVPALREQLLAASEEERLDLLADYVRDHVSQVFRLAKGRTVDRRQRLMDLGIDSLMAIELRNSLGQGLQLARPLTATLMFDHPTIEAIAKFLACEWAAANPAAHADSREPASPQSPRARQVAGMSDEEVELLLLRKLGPK
jgi:SAM-dependent methyltransferase